MDIVGYVLAEQHGVALDEGFSEELSELNRSYADLPDEVEGARACLSVIYEAGLNLGLVTQARIEWTDAKLDYAGYRRFFPRHRVYCVDPKTTKDEVAWRAGMENFGMMPSETLGVGDSFYSDILPLKQAGAWGSVWLQHSFRGQYPLHPYLVNPSHNVYVVERIAEMMERLVGCD